MKIICKAGINKLAINELGDIYPCLILIDKWYKIGNILKENFKEILFTQKYHQYINEKIRKSIVDDKPKCKDCNVRYFCMDECLGITNSFYNNEAICEERCGQIYPYLNKVLWDE